MSLKYFSNFFLVFIVISLSSCGNSSSGIIGGGDNGGGDNGSGDNGGGRISSNGSTKSHNMGQNCMNCHKTGGSGESTFYIAGTVYGVNLTSTFPNATINLTTLPNGAGTLKYTIQVDAKGNFYTTQAIDFSGDLYPSVQGNISTKYMSTPIKIGQCSSCHGVSTDKIWVE